MAIALLSVLVVARPCWVEASTPLERSNANGPPAAPRVRSCNVSEPAAAVVAEPAGTGDAAADAARPSSDSAIASERRAKGKATPPVAKLAHLQSARTAA